MNITRKMRRDLIDRVFDTKKVYDDGYRTKKKVSIISRQDGSIVREGESITWLATHPYFTFDYMVEHNIESLYTMNDKMMYGRDNEGKWHVWSRHGQYVKVFAKGYEVRRGDEAYEATDKVDYQRRALSFWWGEDFDKNRIYTKVSLENEDENGFDIVCQWSEDPYIVANPAARGQHTEHHYNYPKEFGRGEWVAESDDDLKSLCEAYIRNMYLMTL